MKLIGYQRVKGEKDGKSWDFFNLYIERENCRPSAESGGTQLLTTFSKSRGVGFPSVRADEFNSLIRSGLSVGSEINIYRDFDNNIKIDVVK